MRLMTTPATRRRPRWTRSTAMQISNDRDQDNIARLEEQIGEFAFTADPPLTNIEILLALLGAVRGVLLTIDCPGCRAASVKVINKLLPAVVDEVLKQGGEPCGQDRLH